MPSPNSDVDSEPNRDPERNVLRARARNGFLMVRLGLLGVVIPAPWVISAGGLLLLVGGLSLRHLGRWAYGPVVCGTLMLPALIVGDIESRAERVIYFVILAALGIATPVVVLGSIAAYCRRCNAEPLRRSLIRVLIVWVLLLLAVWGCSIAGFVVGDWAPMLFLLLLGPLLLICWFIASLRIRRVSRELTPLVGVDRVFD